MTFSEGKTLQLFDLGDVSLNILTKVLVDEYLKVTLDPWFVV